ANGIQNLSVNKMRDALGRFAGTPVKGVIAGTLITGVLQSSTAMTVMTVGLVNAGVIALRPAISVIMGANIGTTLGNGLIALPLGPLGLFFGGIFALVYIFAKSDKWKNIALALMGFALIFYGLNLMTGGLRPLRAMPEVMDAIRSVNANDFMGLLVCVFTAAVITALIHSSSATIGIVMGLGSAGILDWQTAVAFSLGADLGTTITSWMASLNLSKNAKRAAYAHISFNVIGVLVTIPLFFVAMDALRWVMMTFIGDPSAAVIVGGRETYPLVPIAVGIYSIFFNIFNTALLFPFVGTFERVLNRIGGVDETEDYSIPKYLKAEQLGDMQQAVPALGQELQRYLEGASLHLAAARGETGTPSKLEEHHAALDQLGRDSRSYASRLFLPDAPAAEQDLVASLIEEVDFAGAVEEQLWQIGRRVKRETFSPEARALVDEMLDHVTRSLAQLLPNAPAGELRDTPRDEMLLDLRGRCLRLNGALKQAERGAVLALAPAPKRRGRAEHWVWRGCAPARRITGTGGERGSARGYWPCTMSFLRSPAASV
ncbi:MAG: Na/Pi cotransporter family protein, partial [Rhodospirillales bacterium]|nr:Na/Pi cotransporter family protein [Rhodospirillales bacterium]